MMTLENCPLYGVQSKKHLVKILKIKDSSLLNQDSVISNIKPFLISKEKPRLIEAPTQELKNIQSRIKNLLCQIDVPDNVFSGIKGRFYVDNARIHADTNTRNVYKIDLTAFFPSVNREKVYNFFLKDLSCSHDVSEILTNLTTVDLDRFNSEKIEPVRNFLNNKGVFCYNHLISGSPSSPILSYLSNIRMFDELQNLSDKNHITMSIYVDDITFSSTGKISANFRNSVKSTIRKYDYLISLDKEKLYSKSYPKQITGVIINSKGSITIKNSLRKKTINTLYHLKQNPNDIESLNRLRGFVIAARCVDKSAYPNIRNFAFSKSTKK